MGEMTRKCYNEEHLYKYTIKVIYMFMVQKNIEKKQPFYRKFEGKFNQKCSQNI